MVSNKPWLQTYKKLGLSWERLLEVPQNSLADYVHQHSQGFPDRAALIYCSHTFTYKDLEQKSAALAGVFITQGLRAGDVVALHLVNSPQYVFSLIAALRLGLVVTSVSPLLTSNEVCHQLTDAKARCLISLDTLLESVVLPQIEKVKSLRTLIVTTTLESLPNQPNYSIPASLISTENPTTQLVSFGKAIDETPNIAPRVKTQIDEKQYIQYTGGTTGKSKGVELSALHVFTNNIQTDVFYRYEIGKEVVASAFPFFHIGGLSVLANALRCAATFHVIPNPRDTDQFCQQMKQFPPTVIANVPALFQMLLANSKFFEIDFSDLKLAISGAAPFAKVEIERLELVIGKGKICEVYGMTETSPVQTLNPRENFKPGKVGIPLPQTDIRIVDVENNFKELPSGEAGEIIVSGPQVMKGYYKQPEATHQALRMIDGKRWIRTGDIGYLDEDGYLKVCDRSKDMIIVGGYKVFSVEVETKLQELEFITMCAVVGAKDEKRPGNEIVQLYLQKIPDSNLSEDQMRHELDTFCKVNIAPYKIPKEVFFVDAIPLTSVGKIDKKYLRIE